MNRFILFLHTMVYISSVAEAPSLPNQLTKTDIAKWLINVTKYFGAVIVSALSAYILQSLWLWDFSLQDLRFATSSALVGAAADLLHRYKNDNRKPLL